MGQNYTVEINTQALGNYAIRTNGPIKIGNGLYFGYDNSDALTIRYEDGTVIMTIVKDGTVRIGSELNFTNQAKLVVRGDVSIQELSEDPPDPEEGTATLWMSDGTETGEDGDILMKITAGETTKTVTLVDFSTA